MNSRSRNTSSYFPTTTGETREASVMRLTITIGSTARDNAAVRNRLINACLNLAMLLTISASCRLLIAQEPVYFEDAVAPILRKNCTACHNAKLAEGGLNLESPADVARGGDSGPTFEIANVDASLLLTRPSVAGETIMPPEGNKVGAERLTLEQIAILKKWIVGGAMTRGPNQNMVNHANLRLPESARASYAVAISPDSDIIAFGRGGQLVIHNAQPLAAAQAVMGTLGVAPTQTIRDAHSDFIHSIAISPDGQRIATGSTGQVKIWKRGAPSIDGAKTALKTAGVELSKLLCISSDGNQFATVDLTPSAADVSATDATKFAIKIVKKDGTSLGTFSAPEGSLTFGEWSPSKSRFFAFSASNVLYCWELSANAGTPPTATQFPAPLQSLVALDESTLLVLSERKAAVWQYKTPAAAEHLTDHPLAAAINAGGPTDSICLSPDRLSACSVTQDESTLSSTLKLWNVAQAKLSGTFERDRKAQLAMLYSDSELRRTQAAVERCKVMVTEQEKALEAEQAAVKAAQEGLEKATKAIETKEKEMQTALAGIAEHEKAMADAKTTIDAAMQKLTQLTVELEPKKKALAELEKQKSESSAMVENSTQALAGIQENQKTAVVKLEERKHNVETQTSILANVQSKNAGVKTANESIRFSVQSVAFSGTDTISATRVVENALSKEIDFFSVDTLERTESLSIDHPAKTSAELAAIVQDVHCTWQQESVFDSPSIVIDRATAVAFSPDGTLIAIGSGLASRSGQLAIVNVADGKPLKTIPELHSDTILGLAYSPDGRWLASCGADKMTKLLSTPLYEIAKLFEGHTHHVLALAWQEDANRLATASSDMTIKIWDIEKGESIRTITGFGTEVTSVAFLGSTPNTISSTMNNLVRMHDSNTGKQNKQFGPTPDSLYCIAGSPNGKYFVATGQEGITRIWNAEDGRMIAEWK